MLVRFLIDSDTGLPHIDKHDVSPIEVLEVLRGRSFQQPGRDGTRIAEGQTLHGRYLRVVYKENDDDGTTLVITAHDLNEKSKRAYRRRKRRRQ
jgi:hypothetical protein